MALVKDSDLAAYRSLRERVSVEGWAYSAGALTEDATWTTDGSVSATAAMPGITRAWFIDTITVSCSKNARVQISWNSSGFDATRGEIIQVALGAYTPLVIPVGRMVRSATAQTAGSGGAPGASVRKVYDADKTATHLTLWAQGWSLTDDMDYAAPKTMLWIGDSITAGGTGPTIKTNQFDWRVRKYYRDKGIRVRMVNMSLSGQTSIVQESRRAQGAFDGIPADLICYSMGPNDAAQGVAASTYRANVDAAIAWKKVMHPAARMVVFGPTPNENNTTEAAQVTLRAEAAAAVTAAADSKVKFCDLGSAFNRTTASNYASSDAAGSRVHPSDAGHAAIWAVVQPFLDANAPVI